jgi:hypothetical protein
MNIFCSSIATGLRRFSGVTLCIATVALRACLGCPRLKAEVICLAGGALCRFALASGSMAGVKVAHSGRPGLRRSMVVGFDGHSGSPARERADGVSPCVGIPAATQGARHEIAKSIAKKTGRFITALPTALTMFSCLCNRHPGMKVPAARRLV